MKVRGAERARVSLWRQVDLDELPDNQPLGGWGRIDKKNKEFNPGIFHLRKESAAFQPGGKSSLQYHSDNPAVGGDLQSAKVNILFTAERRYHMNQPGGPTGMTAHRLKSPSRKRNKTCHDYNYAQLYK